MAATQTSPGREMAGNPAMPSGQPIFSLDGIKFQGLLLAGLAWLDQHHEIVNALNVFPVPDGDTGTNMLLTMKSACREISEEHTRSVGHVAKAAAHGALMGARGNSGVILSQILRGISRSLGEQAALTGPALASALTEGSRVAYKGVNRPVEGTILTVAREAAAAAESAAQLDNDVRFILARTVRAADEAVANTPNLLPILKQTGKVDSGGKGLFFILEGMYRALVGERAEATVSPEVAAPGTPPRATKGRRELPPLVYGFDVQFLVEGVTLDVAAIRDHITAMGDCPLVEGDENLIKVHVHVSDPGVALSYAVSLGFVSDVVVENMDDMQIPDMPAGYDPLPPRFAVEVPAAPVETDQSARCQAEGPIEGPGVVAVVPGAGLAQVFLSLGTHCIVSGGQTMNPSTQDLLEAVNRLPTSEVILLPNNSNILMAAQQAQSLAADLGKTVSVIPSKSIPQGISALLALNPHADLTHNTQTMSSALTNVQTGEVTTAVQDAYFDGIQVHASQIIGLLNDRLSVTGPTPEAVVAALLEQMDAASLEVITLYYGEPVNADQVAGLRDTLQQLYPDHEIEIVDGGQPFYHYIISAE